MARANVPKFGNWDSDDNVPYTVYFDKARKNRGGKMVNPNDPQEMLDTSHDTNLAPTSPTPSKPRNKTSEQAFKSPERGVREDVDAMQFANPPRNENTNQRATNEPSYGAHRQKPARPTKPEQMSDRSPLHPNQVKGAGRTGPPYESSHGNIPGRQRPRSPTRLGDESPDQGAYVPKFGDWNDNDPQSAENFTDIFNKVREEKNAGPGIPSGTPKHSYAINKQPNKKKKCGCFGL